MCAVYLKTMTPGQVSMVLIFSLFVTHVLIEAATCESPAVKECRSETPLTACREGCRMESASVACWEIEEICRKAQLLCKGQLIILLYNLYFIIDHACMLQRVSV